MGYFEHMVLDRYAWSLYDLDRTDIESLIPFANYHVQEKQPAKVGKAKAVYCDEVDWL